MTGYTRKTTWPSPKNPTMFFFLAFLLVENWYMIHDPCFSFLKRLDVMKTSSFQVGLIYENFNITILRAGKCGWSTSTHGCRLAAMMQTKKVSAAAVQQWIFFLNENWIHILEPKLMEVDGQWVSFSIAWFWGEPVDNFPGCKWKGSIANATTYKNWWVFSS